MNQPLSQQFAEAVKAGKCDAFTYTPAQDSPILGHEEIRFAGEKFEFWGDGAFDRPSTLNGHWRIAFNEPFICHHIREWLTGQGKHVRLFLSKDWGVLMVGTCNGDPENFQSDFENGYDEGTQLDWHIQAVVDICARKEEGS